MNIRKYLANTINEKIEKTGRELKNTRKSLKELENTKFKNATYVVNIISSWAHDGEKNLKYNYLGTLEEAIKASEKLFMEINGRANVDGNYKVGIWLGENIYDLPDEYWKNYCHCNLL